MSVASPTPFQTSTSATEKSAHCGSVSQPGPARPIVARPWLIRPSNGSSSTLKVMPMPIVDTSTGKNTTLRRKPRPMICELSSTPRAMPSTIFRPEVIAA